jgi:hypothetical protein
MKTRKVTTRAAARLVLDAWRAQGWSDTAGTALAMTDAHVAGVSLAGAVPDMFCVRNGCTVARVAAVAAEALRDVSVQVEQPTIIDPEQIDSFARVSTVTATEVAGIPRPLALAEADVKRALLEILGVSEVPADWGGERSDAFSTHVYLGDQRIASSFVLKGPAKRGELTPADYGKNGDQMQRSFTQPASLHVIQANASIAPSVRELANGLVLNARSQGDERAVASIWDGTDTARILAAYGYIDPKDGSLLR